jgi:hypothetical protein
MPSFGRCANCGWFSHIWGSSADTEMELLDHTQASHGEDAVLCCDVYTITGVDALKLRALMKLPAFWRTFPKWFTLSVKIPTSKPRTRAPFLTAPTRRSPRR